MKTCVKSLAPALVIAMLSYTGCAKQEIVRKDDSIATATSSSRQEEATSSAAKPAAPTQTAAIKGAPAPANPATVPAREQAAAAKAADPATVAAEVQRQLEKIYFDFDSASLSEAARHSLTSNAALVSRNPGVKVRIEGYCDERGSDEYNLAVGERRAKAAAQYLKSLGVGAERISTVSYGKEKPAAPGHDEAAWAKNRRDEFVVVR